VTYTTRHAVNLYAGYSEGNRAPTSIELGCANPNQPCKLPNAMAGDPPLDQVVTRTLEAGIRGGTASSARFSWSAGLFRTRNDQDILFVSSPQTGFGYFKNFGETRRQGIELGVNRRMDRVRVGGGYTFLDATYQSAETIDGTGKARASGPGSADSTDRIEAPSGEIDTDPKASGRLSEGAGRGCRPAAEPHSNARAKAVILRRQFIPRRFRRTARSPLPAGVRAGRAASILPLRDRSMRPRSW